MTRGLAFVRSAEGELGIRMVPGQAAAASVPDVPLDYGDDEALEIVRAVDGAISLAGTHSWADIIGSGTATGVLDERETPA
jgi:hypothetical protein